MHRLPLNGRLARRYPLRMATDLTVEILRDIRDGVSATNLRLASMDQRLESMDQRLESMDQRLGRTEQGLSDLGRFMRQIALDQTRHERFHVHHVDVLERDVEDLKDRVSRLEAKIED
jgi:predicted  nucleic acid-binding Zn-ribbon protein